MSVTQKLKDKLQTRFGRPVTTMADCEALALEINSGREDEGDEKSGMHISTMTIARMFCVSENARSSRPGTMDMIARYLDFCDADEMAKALGEKPAGQMFKAVDHIDPRLLGKGAQVHLAYNPDRDVVMTNLGDGRFLVNESHNSKLRKGDEIHVGCMARGCELSVRRVVRDGIVLGPYQAGKCGGLILLEIIGQ